MSTIVLLAGLLVATGPLELDPDFQNGQIHEDNFAYGDALKAYQKALAGNHVDTDRARIWLRIAICHANLHEPEAVDSDLENAIEADPNVDTPADFSPALRDLLESIRRRPTHHSPRRDRTDPTKRGSPDKAPDESKLADPATTAAPRPQSLARKPAEGGPVASDESASWLASSLASASIAGMVLSAFGIVGYGTSWLAVGVVDDRVEEQMDAAALGDILVAAQWAGLAVSAISAVFGVAAAGGWGWVSLTSTSPGDESPPHD